MTDQQHINSARANEQKTIVQEPNDPNDDPLISVGARQLNDKAQLPSHNTFNERTTTSNANANTSSRTTFHPVQQQEQNDNVANNNNDPSATKRNTNSILSSSSSQSNTTPLNSKKRKVTTTDNNSDNDLDNLGELSEPEEEKGEDVQRTIIETTDNTNDNNNSNSNSNSNTDDGGNSISGGDAGGDDGAVVEPGTEGITSFNDYDVLSGRGGGTNVHPGNRNFRDLINLHRRAYLKARKNDKPTISRAIVRSVRENNGRFLRKDEISGLWLEIDDEAAREKTSQALRQRAPEMRKLLFDTEQEEARAVVEEHIRQQHQQTQQTQQAAMMMTTTSGGGINLIPPGIATAPVMSLPPTTLMPQGMLPMMMPTMPHPGMIHPGMVMTLPTTGQPMFPNPMLFSNITNGGVGQFFPTALYGGQGMMNQFTQQQQQQPNGS